MRCEQDGRVKIRLTPFLYCISSEIKSIGMLTFPKLNTMGMVTMTTKSCHLTKGQKPFNINQQNDCTHDVTDFEDDITSAYVTDLRMTS